ncbi:hypothetical protein ApAK_01890 [Thermoplasmatales archaeon AK]|nr:hypothetical protein [Thermoplasmatales archaeon AK]
MSTGRVIEGAGFLMLFVAALAEIFRLLYWFLLLQFLAIALIVAGAGIFPRKQRNGIYLSAAIFVVLAALIYFGTLGFIVSKSLLGVSLLAGTVLPNNSYVSGILSYGYAFYYAISYGLCYYLFIFTILKRLAHIGFLVTILVSIFLRLFAYFLSLDKSIGILGHNFSDTLISFANLISLPLAVLTSVAGEAILGIAMLIVAVIILRSDSFGGVRQTPSKQA